MAFSGPYTPALVRRALEAFEDQRGWLAVSDGRRDLCWVCAREGVRVVYRGFTPPTPGQWLALGGALSAEQEQRLQAARAAGLPEAQALKKAGIPASQVEAASRSLVAQLVVDALFWDDPHADGDAGEAPFGERLLRRDLEVMSASVPLATVLADVKDRLSRAAGTLKALPTAAISVVTTGEAGARQHLSASQDALERQVLERILQRPGVHGDELVVALACGEGQLMLRLLRLIEARVVQVERLPQDQAARRAALGKPISAPDELPARLWLANVAEAVGEPARAAQQLTTCGWTLLSQGRQAEAAELFSRAQRLEPEDPRALQGRVTAAWGLAREEEAAQLSETLARDYLALGLPRQAQLTVARALEARETSALLDLSVQALIEMGELRAAERLTGSLVLQLRKEGRARDAERAAQRIEAARPAGSTSSQLRAQPADGGGAAKLIAVVCLLVAPALGLGLAWVRRELAARREYAHTAGQVSLSLQSSPPREREGWLQLAARFPAASRGSEPVRRANEQARAQATSLAEDAALLAQARDAIQFAWATDLSLASSQLEQLEPHTAALREPLEAVTRRAEELLDQATRTRLRVSGFGRAGDLQPGFDEAKRFLAEFPNVPQELQAATVWIEIQSEPPGALVTWRGQATQQRTPLRIDIPVLGKRELRLELAGHAPLETVVQLAGLESPTPRFQLQPAGGPR